MSVKINLFWKGFIYGLSEVKYSYSMIQKECAKRGLNISKFTISKIIQFCKQQPDKVKGTQAKMVRRRPQPKRSRLTIAEVRRNILKENPPTQRSLANRIGISQRTVGRIIHSNLNLEMRHKSKGHRLSDRHVRERFTNARKLYEKYLARDRWMWVVTLDEAWVYLDNTNKPRAIYYKEKGTYDRSNFVNQCKEKYSKGFMVVAGYSSRGKLRIRKIASKAKINSEYFQNNIMKPIYCEDIPFLYGHESTKVLIHMDKASSHTSKSSRAWYEIMKNETKIQVIPFSSIPVKSPDASPMDFCGFGLLKRGLADRRPKSVDGLWKVCKEVWDGIPQVALRKSLLQWKLRCRAIVHNRGLHIEHNRWWLKGIK